MSGPSLPTADGVRAALGIVRQHLPETPLIFSELLSRAFDAEVWLKYEAVSPIASFKLRGAITVLERARANGTLKGGCTSSTGNHGQGVAYGSRLLGVPAAIFLPDNPNPTKKAMIEAFGGTVHVGGRDIDAAKDRAKIYAAEHGYTFVDDGESLDLMEGAGTVGLEIAERLDGIGVIYAPMGSGTFATGVACAAKSLQPDMKVIAVQAKEGPAMVESFHAKAPIERDTATVADGLACRVPAERALAGLLEYVDDAVALPDADLLAGVRTLAEDAHLLVEPSGAAALAAAWAARGEIAGKKVVLILSGSNITPDLLNQAVNGPRLF